MFSCLFSDNMAQDSAKIEKGCGSSVVEHSLGKGEVESSILSRSTILFILLLPPFSCPTNINHLYRILHQRKYHTQHSLPSKKSSCFIYCCPPNPAERHLSPTRPPQFLLYKALFFMSPCPHTD